MLTLRRTSILARSTISGLALAAALVAVPTYAQSQSPSAPSASPATQTGTNTEAVTPEPVGASEEIVVTGFRASLNSALAVKQNETAAVDSIVAEDIGKFPDSNLAESMQRVPGVALSRGDGGEGKTIAVRGLGSGFTRVRINGMEGTSQTGAADIYGAGNSGRSFDFNVFPTEIFSSLSVRKTTSADVEEGSLGATVDLKAPHPLDYKTDFVATATVRGIYNEVSKNLDPRASALISKQFGDGTFGILGSVSYQKRRSREVGYSAVDILSSDTNGLVTGGANQPFCTPVGFTPISPSPVAQAAKGATAANCSTGNPRTGTLAAYNTIINLRRASLPAVQGSGAFLPRLPRYVNSTQDTDRYGGTLTLQWKPDENTDISLDNLYSRYDVTRRDNYIAGISFGRNVNNNGQPMVSVKDIQFDANGSIVYGLFDGVDVRSEGLVDHYVSSFKQSNLNFDHRFSDSFQVTGLIGIGQSILDGKSRFQTYIDAIDTRNFVIDYRDGKSTPIVGFGFDVANPANFNLAPNQADGTVLGGFDFQGKPSKNTTTNKTAELNLVWNATDSIALKFGGQYRLGDFKSYTSRPTVAATTLPLPAGTTLASLTTQITNLDSLFGRGAPASWVAIDSAKFRQAFNIDARTFCQEECGGGRSQIRETIKSGYVMANFNFEEGLPIPVRGDMGVRYVHTDQHSVGFIPIAAVPVTATPTGLVGQRAQVDRTYDDWLPSANVVLEFTPTLLGRISGAKVLSRPELGNITPSSGITATTRTGNINNPLLDPIRANTFDAALEWYFKRGSLLSVAYFYKDIKSYIQRVNSLIPFNQLGLPDALLAGSASIPSDIFTVGQLVNTPGGPLKGYEINGQFQLDFLPSILKNLGVLANYTHVKSKIDYVLSSVNGVPTATTTDDLVNLSKDTASGTVYYDDGKFSIRGTASYRGKYIRAIPASPGSDIQGNKANTFVDASASYALTDNIKLILEAQNLTNERNTLYIDSVRQDTLFETKIGRTFNFGATVRF